MSHILDLSTVSTLRHFTETFSFPAGLMDIFAYTLFCNLTPSLYFSPEQSPALYILSSGKTSLTSEMLRLTLSSRSPTRPNVFAACSSLGEVFVYDLLEDASSHVLEIPAQKGEDASILL